MNLPMYGTEVFLLIPAIVAVLLLKTGRNSPEIVSITPQLPEYQTLCDFSGVESTAEVAA